MSYEFNPFTGTFQKTSKLKTYITGTHRWAIAPGNTDWNSGPSKDHRRQARVLGLGTSIDLATGNYTDTAISGTSAYRYADWIAPSACTVTAMNGCAEQDTANAGIHLALFKATPVDDDDNTADLAAAYITKLDFPPNTDTQSLHDEKDCTTINTSNSSLSKGDLLVLVYRKVTPHIDANNWYITHNIEVTF